MTSRRRLVLVSLLLVAYLMLPLPFHTSTMSHVATITVAHAQESESATRSFVVVVSREGFNGTDSSNLNITVNEGDLVHITFIMAEEDQQAGGSIGDDVNHHRIEITGYGVISDRITSESPEATVTFLASKAGTFTIRCGAETWDCPGHNLMQDGVLTVRGEEPPSNGEPPSVEPPEPVETQVSLVTSTSCHSTCRVALEGSLTDVDDEPVVGMPVVFSVNTTFGLLSFGSSFTDADGRVASNYTSGFASALNFTASFEGGFGYEASAAQSVVEIPGASTDLSTSLFTPRNVAGGIAVATIVSVWAVFAFVFRQIQGISAEDDRTE